MFGIGWTELVVIAFVLLIFVGPRQLPGMFRKAGQLIGELKAASRELRNQVTTEVRDLEDGFRDSVSPRDIVSDLKSDLEFEVGSPYAAIHRSEAALKKGKERLKEEIQSIKQSIEEDGESGEHAATSGKDDTAEVYRARADTPEKGDGGPVDHAVPTEKKS